MAVRYATTRILGDLKDTLGRSVKKDLRECVYNKIVRLGVRSTDDMSMAGLTQIAPEGVEQLDLYYSSYLPQFFYAMLAPLLLFAITVGISWRVALVLLCCVPFIPLSIDKILLYGNTAQLSYPQNRKRPTTKGQTHSKICLRGKAQLNSQTGSVS